MVNKWLETTRLKIIELHSMQGFFNQTRNLDRDTNLWIGSVDRICIRIACLFSDTPMGLKGCTRCDEKFKTSMMMH